MERIIEIQDMYKIYNPGDNEVRALDGVSLSVDKGDFLAIVGHSGSGKSTLMNMLGCLDAPTSGLYRLEGQDVSILPIGGCRISATGLSASSFRASTSSPG